MNAEPFYRLLPNRVWRTYLGGGTLDAISGVQPPEDGHFPEDWILSTTRAVNVGRKRSTRGSPGFFPVPANRFLLRNCSNVSRNRFSGVNI